MGVGTLEARAEGPPPDMLGRWGMSMTGPEACKLAYMILQADGLGLTVYKDSASAFTYSVAGDQITRVIEGKPETRPFRLVGDKLDFPAMTYVRCKS